MIVELQYNIRGLLNNLLRVSKYLHVIENQSLVPRWVQCGSKLLGCLAEVQEGDVSVRICRLEIFKKDLTFLFSRLLHSWKMEDFK